MSTPEPPDGSTHPARPGPDGPGSGSGADEPRTEESHRQDHPAEGTQNEPAATGGRRWWRPRRPQRRWPVVAGGVVVGLLVLGLVFGLGALAGAHHARHDRFAHGGHGWMGHGRMHGMGHHGMGAGGMGAGGMGPGGMGADGMAGMGPGDGRAGGGPGGRPGRGMAMPSVTGSLVTIDGANMVVAPDGAAPITVTVSPQTRVVGPGRSALTDLKAGDRVAVREGVDHQAVGVLVVPARAVGTISAVNGNQATLVRPDGLTEPVDLTAVTTKPAVGDRVMVEGTATGNGATLAATQLRQLPKAG